MQALNTRFKNLSVSYLLSGPSSAKTTVVFIHGFPFDKSIWASQLESLADDITGIAYDIRGFGSSTTDHQFFSIDLLARDLIGLIEALQIKKCVLCGISMGGYIALRALQIANDKIAGLILCDTNCTSDGNENKLKRFSSIEKILGGEKAEFIQGFVKNVFAAETLEGNPGVVDFLRNLISSTSDETICATLLALASRTDTSDSLETISVPTLVIRGESDSLMTEEQTQQLVKGISDSEYVSIPRSGHLPNLENAGAFNDAINAFLRKHFLS